MKIINNKRGFVGLIVLLVGVILVMALMSWTVMKAKDVSRAVSGEVVTSSIGPYSLNAKAQEVVTESVWDKLMQRIGLGSEDLTDEEKKAMTDAMKKEISEDNSFILISDLFSYRFDMRVYSVEPHGFQYNSSVTFEYVYDDYPAPMLTKISEKEGSALLPESLNKLNSKKTVVCQEGGVIEYEGLRLTIPAGALSKCKEISIGYYGVSALDFFLSDSPILLGADNTCFDGEMDNGEEGVDCGGSCPSCGSNGECKDTDEGANAYYTFGNVYHGDSFFDDFCINNNSLQEYYCSPSYWWLWWGPYMQEEVVECEFGCSMGACLTEPVKVCSDSDNGLNYYVKGNYNSLVESGSEFCVNSSTVWEYACSGSELYSLNYTCSNGCSDGACVKDVVLDLPPEPESPERV